MFEIRQKNKTETLVAMEPWEAAHLSLQILKLLNVLGVSLYSPTQCKKAGRVRSHCDCPVAPVRMKDPGCQGVNRYTRDESG